MHSVRAARGVIAQRELAASSSQPASRNAVAAMPSGAPASERPDETAAEDLWRGACRVHGADDDLHGAASDVDLDRVAVRFHQLAPRRRLALPISRTSAAVVARASNAPCATGSRRRVSGLSVVSHSCWRLSAEALEAADRPYAFAAALLAQLVEDRGEFAVVECVERLPVYAARRRRHGTAAATR